MRNLVTRAAWDARAPRSVNLLEPEDARYLAVHYTAANADEQALHGNCAARVRGIQAYHMDVRGWADIAYSWVFCKHGYIYRGRGIGVRTAATGVANGYTYAACFLGDDTAGRDDVTKEGRAALKEIHAFVTRNCPNLRGVRGHRDFMATSCPGDELYRFLRTL